MKPLQGVLALLLVTVSTGVVLAEPVTVEVVVFRYEAAAEISQWPPAEGLPSFTGARPLDEPGSTAGTESWYAALPASSLRLAGAASALRRAGGREVLLHTAWRQPSAEGALVYLKAEAADPLAPPALEASLVVHEVGRDLKLSGDFMVGLGSDRVQVRSEQKFKPGELRYVDHALLGVLVEVTPIEAPAAGPEGTEGDAAPVPTGGQQGPAD